MEDNGPSELSSNGHLGLAETEAHRSALEPSLTELVNGHLRSRQQSVLILESLLTAVEAQLAAAHAEHAQLRALVEREAPSVASVGAGAAPLEIRREPTWFQPDPDGTERRDPIGDLRFALRYSETIPLQPPTRRFDPEHMRLHWMVKEILPGGGATTVLRIVRYLEHSGHTNTIWLTEPLEPAQLTALRRDLRQGPLGISADIHSLTTATLCRIEGDAVIATHYSTAYPARAVRNVRQRFYFIQDFEPSFDPLGSRSLLAEATYRFGFHALAASPWLRDLMREEYDADVDAFDLAVDHDVYHPRPDIARRPEHIAFYARPHTPRRAVELGLMALELVAVDHPEITVDMFGYEWGGIDVPYKYVDHGVVEDEAALAEIYCRANLGMVFSASNVSLVPREMMACGLPVVELESASTRAAFPGGVAALCPPDPFEIAKVIVALLEQPRRREALSRRGLAHVAELSWKRSGAQVETALRDSILRHDPVGHARLLRWQESGPVTRTMRRVEKLGRRLGAKGPSFSFQRPLVWVGQPEYFRCAFYDDLGEDGLEFPISSADQRRLRVLPAFCRRYGARTVVMFRPEWLCGWPQVLAELRDLGVAVIGYSTEPVPHDWSRAHADQMQRLQSLLPARELDLDLLIHFDAWSQDLLEELGFPRVIAWPLPTSESLFFPRETRREFDVCFTGKSTLYRESFLMPLKARFNVVHAAHGLTDQACARLMNRSHLVLNIHNEPYLNFEHRVVQALFCGRPVLSQPLSGGYLCADKDYITFEDPDDLSRQVTSALAHDPQPAAIERSTFTVQALTSHLGL
jgi:glycosyltransferase involved in cell wall biosynthesis